MITIQNSIVETLAHHYHAIEQWFARQQSVNMLYASSDVRNAAYKISVIDTNIFPGGFNNLSSASMVKASQEFSAYFSTVLPKVRRILLIPESHTRNQPYFENLAALQLSLQHAGFEVMIGSLLIGLKELVQVPLAQGTLALHPLRIERRHVSIDGFEPDLIVLNHDLSEGVPDILKNAQVPVIPHPQLGWWRRLKSTHFNHYQHYATELAQAIQIDPWFLQPIHQVCADIDFASGAGMDHLVAAVHRVLADTQRKYAEYGIKDQPFVVIKADAGTYGMAVMPLSDPEVLVQLNRKQRMRMAQAKGGVKVHQVLIQEGIYTVEQTLHDHPQYVHGHAQLHHDSSTSEPVVYSVGGVVVGSFQRYHRHRSASENLNSPGMEFKAFDDGHAISPEFSGEHAKTYYAHRVVARLALLALNKERIDVE